MKHFIFLAALLGACIGVFAQSDNFLQQCDPVELTTPKSIAFINDNKYIQVGTIRFSYHEFGPVIDVVAEAREEGVAEEDLPTVPPPLLLIHGFGSTQYDWPIDMIENLQLYRKVVIFDNPRIGLSTDTSQDPLTISYMATATLDFITALGLERPDILGFSMGAMIAMELAAKYGGDIGNVVAVAGSFGGPKAPQAKGGLAPVLDKLQAFFLAKYAAPAQTTTSVAPFFKVAATDNTTGEQIDVVKLFFPLGSLDPAACNLMNDFISLNYAIGTYPLDGFAGYALPGIIPSVLAVVPTPEVLSAQSAAILAYHTLESDVAALLKNVSNQIMYVSGVQDNVIPITTQLSSVAMTPGAWLLQVPDGGHGLPFLEPTSFAGTVASFLDKAQAISPASSSYYDTPPASAAMLSKLSGLAAFAASALTLALMA